MPRKIKKIIPYCLIFIILVGLFSPGAQVNAQFAPPVCTGTDTSTTPPIRTPPGCIEPLQAVAALTSFEQELDACSITSSSTWGLCLAKFFYYTIFQLPAWILWLAAQFFDVMVDLGIKSSVTSSSGFIPAAWAVVRDLSNIFFILILLYIAIKTILGLGGSEVKKMIARVIIIALLINFSMFFTKIVIDSSNILALIFYNKLDVTNPDGIDVPIDPAALGPGGKNMSGAIWTNFDATQLITGETIKLLKTNLVNGKTTEEKTLSVSLTIGIMVVAGAIMLWAAYAFFVAGLMFMGRLIELWILIIFSPFAFMSWTMPKFASIEYLGWDAWLKRLISTAFMAPIFMFFMYLIFLLLPHISELNRKSTTILGVILNILIPALIIMAMLLKAVHFAKKGGGQFGELIMKTAKIAGGVALGAATGGVALAARGTIGRAGAAVAESGLAKRWEARGWGGERFRRMAQATGGASFDVRGAKIGGKTLASATGIPVGEAQKGGFEQRRKEQVEKRQKRAQGLEVGEDEKLKQHLNTMEVDLQGVFNTKIKEIEDFDRKIKEAKEINDTATAKQLIIDKGAMLNGLSVNTIDSTGKNAQITVKELKDNINDQRSSIVKENRRRKWNYADTTESGLGRVKDFVFSGGQNSYKGSREAAHKIRMEQKIDTGEKH